MSLQPPRNPFTARFLERKGDNLELHYIDRPFEVKEIDDAGVFTGYGSVFGNVDSYREIVAPGAFADSLAQWKASGRLPPVLWQHRSGEPIGPHLDMREDANGLLIKGHLLVDDVARAREARALMKAKAINGLSIGFVTRKDSYDKLTGVRTLIQVDLWEVSVVTFAANPQAQITGIKSAIDEIETLAAAERYLRDAGGFSRAGATAFIGRVKALANRGEPDELGEVLQAMKALQTTLST